MKDKTPYRLYSVGAGQLTKLHYGRKGFEHETLAEAEEYAENFLKKAKHIKQIVIQTDATIVTVVSHE